MDVYELRLTKPSGDYLALSFEVWGYGGGTTNEVIVERVIASGRVNGVYSDERILHDET